MSKKSKRYREECKYQTPPNIENNSSSTESDSDASESQSLLWLQNIDALPYYFLPPRDVKDKCIQCSVKTHNSGIQNVPTSRSKILQTDHRTKASRGIQTSTEHCVKSTGDNLLSILQSDNVFNLFRENYMKVSRPINLSKVSNPLHQADFQQQIWLGKVSWIWDVCAIYNRQHKWCMTVSGLNFAKSYTTCLGQV